MPEPIRIRRPFGDGSPHCPFRGRTTDGVTWQRPPPKPVLGNGLMVTPKAAPPPGRAAGGSLRRQSAGAGRGSASKQRERETGEWDYARQGRLGRVAPPNSKQVIAMPAHAGPPAATGGAARAVFMTRRPKAGFSPRRAPAPRGVMTATTEGLSPNGSGPRAAGRDATGRRLCRSVARALRKPSKNSKPFQTNSGARLFATPERAACGLVGPHGGKRGSVRPNGLCHWGRGVVAVFALASRVAGPEH